jgi:hypothetical protein
MRAIRKTIVALMTLQAAAMLMAANAPKPAAATPPANVILRGQLMQLHGTIPVIETSGKAIMLAGMNHYIFRTLQDKRLAKDEVELHGHQLPDGFFQVDSFYTIHHGKRYWIRYYCETCNIAALAPGHCVCCQQPTELQQIPVGVSGGPDPKGVIITH